VLEWKPWKNGEEIAESQRPYSVTLLEKIVWVKKKKRGVTGILRKRGGSIDVKSKTDGRTALGKTREKKVGGTIILKVERSWPWCSEFKKKDSRYMGH